MRKGLLLFALSLGLFYGNEAFAGSCSGGSCSGSSGGNNNGSLVDCNIDTTKDYPADGPCVCYCPRKCYTKRYFYTSKCNQVACPSYKRCCRQVPQYYQKTFCRYVPQYYQNFLPSSSSILLHMRNKIPPFIQL